MRQIPGCYRPDPPRTIAVGKKNQKKKIKKRTHILIQSFYNELCSCNLPKVLMSTANSDKLKIGTFNIMLWEIFRVISCFLLYPTKSHKRAIVAAHRQRERFVIPVTAE